MDYKGAGMKKIIHIDMDAFYAAIEQRDHPEYRGKPVAVGGDPFGRGVVSAASYEARKFGIHSAMSASRARRLCPQAVFLRPDFEKYKAVSSSIMEILRQHTGLVEPVSLDEAYLDVTRHRLGMNDPVLIAALMKQTIYAVTKLTASAGVAPNLFLAKMASDLDKPNGLMVVRENEALRFLKDLPARKIPGIGPVTEGILRRMNIRTCGELAQVELSVLLQKFGKWGKVLYDRARGIDEREVEPHWIPKQYSTEETFHQDERDKAFLKSKLREFADEVFEHLRRQGRMGRTVTLKVKYFDFELITRSRTLPQFPLSGEEIYLAACDLLEKKTEAGAKPIRLLGVGMSRLEEWDEKHTSIKEDDLFGVNLKS